MTKMHANRDDTAEWEMLVNEVKNLRSSINPPVPNPAPLGLFAFGLTTALLQVRHTRIGGSSEDDREGVDAIVLGFAMCFGKSTKDPGMSTLSPANSFLFIPNYQEVFYKL